MPINKLASMVKVSESTLRRDIMQMEQENIVVRNKGRITLAENVTFVSARKDVNIVSKQKIGAAAAKLIENNDTIYIDSSTTTLEMVRKIPRNLTLNIVTNNLTIALELEKYPLINVVMLGGMLMNGTSTLLGGIAERNLEGLFFDKAFMGAGGISNEGVVSYYFVQVMNFMRILLEKSEKIIILADSSKYNRNCFVSMITPDMIDTLVTDYIPEELKKHYASFNVNIVHG